MLPVVAIVGRPNVGKSTLFNRLQGRRRAIVQDQPGVTRDRHYRTAELGGRRVLLVDTGGFDPGASGGLVALIRQQTQLAIEEADLILHLLDAREGLLDSDREVVDALRRCGKPVIHVANKVDGPRQELLVGEFYEIGAERILQLSAEHGLGFDELEQAVMEALPPLPGPPAGEEGEDPAPRVALVGRPNAGKSSLLNALTGQQRAIVSQQPGTTRDPVDVRLQTSAGPLTLVDTAGIRRRRSVTLLTEKVAVLRAMRSIYDADVTCLLLDPLEGVVDQDARIASQALEAGRALVLIVSKLDLLQPPGAEKRRLRQQVQEQLRFAPFAPLLFLSSVTGKGVARLLPTVRRVHGQWDRRIATAELNRFLEQATAEHVPPTHHGKPVKLYYITQPQARPPTFIVSTNTVPGVKVSYRRYLVNRLREAFGFEGTPLRVYFRRRGGDKEKQGKGRGRGRSTKKKKKKKGR
jgi:GTP-binding protein